MMTEETEQNSDQETGEKSFSGKYLIAVIFFFAVIMTATLYIYWRLHTGPFLPLQQALAEEFEGCQPLVQGGQKKMHKNTPKVLRVTMKVEFNPLVESEESKAFISSVSEFIKENWNLSDYDELHLHFYKKNPEKKLQEKVFPLQVKDILSEPPAA